LSLTWTVQIFRGNEDDEVFVTWYRTSQFQRRRDEKTRKKL
jgi:hypothetical protein